MAFKYSSTIEFNFINNNPTAPLLWQLAIASSASMAIDCVKFVCKITVRVTRNNYIGISLAKTPPPLQFHATILRTGPMKVLDFLPIIGLNLATLNGHYKHSHVTCYKHSSFYLAPSSTSNASPRKFVSCETSLISKCLATANTM